jgi:hypothetical protein
MYGPPLVLLEQPGLIVPEYLDRVRIGLDGADWSCIWPTASTSNPASDTWMADYWRQIVSSPLDEQDV